MAAIKFGMVAGIRLEKVAAFVGIHNVPGRRQIRHRPSRLKQLVDQIGWDLGGEEAKRPHTSTSYICIGGGVDPGGKSSGDGSSIGCGGRSSPGIGAGGMIGGIGSGICICMPHQRLNWLRGAGGGERTKAGIVFELLRSRRAATE